MEIQLREGTEFSVNARDLHAWLEVGRKFADWIKERTEQYDFREGTDFITSWEKPITGRPRQEYFITLDMAKQLSMVQGNPRGLEVARFLDSQEDGMSNVEMIQVVEGTEFAVSARDLHAFLGVREKFADWVREQISRASLEGDADYTVEQIFPKIRNNSRGRPRQEYFLTLDAAKHISMMSNTSRGKEARKYFIEAEKRLRATSKPMSQLEILVQSAQQLLEVEKRQALMDAKLKDIEAKVQEVKAIADHTEDYATVRGFFVLVKARRVTRETAKLIGIAAAKRCKEQGIAVDRIDDLKWGKINAYPKDILAEVAKEFGIVGAE